MPDEIHLHSWSGVVTYLLLRGVVQITRIRQVFGADKRGSNATPKVRKLDGLVPGFDEEEEYR